MNIAIHPKVEARLRIRADAEGLTVESYVERIVRDDEQAEQELIASPGWTQLRRADRG